MEAGLRRRIDGNVVPFRIQTFREGLSAIASIVGREGFMRGKTAKSSWDALDGERHKRREWLMVARRKDWRRFDDVRCDRCKFFGR